MKAMTIQSENGRIELIDYLKGFSILTIVVMHLIQTYMDQVPGWFSKLSSIGGSGVHVFFFCSGAGLFIGWQKRRYTMGQFFRRRLVKIYVPYILVVAVCALLPWIDPEQERLSGFLSHLLLYKMFNSTLDTSFGPFWFISAIIQFYILFIPLCRLKEKLKNDRLFCLGALVISAAWWVLVFAMDAFERRAWSSFCLQYLWEFALGMCVGGYLASGKALKLPYVLMGAGALAGLAIQAAMSFSSDTLRIFNDIPGLFGYMLLAALLYNLPVFGRVGKQIAGFSYEWYLTHMLVLGTVFHFAAPHTLLSQIILGLAGLILSIAAAAGYKKLTGKLLK